MSDLEDEEVVAPNSARSKNLAPTRAAKKMKKAVPGVASLVPEESSDGGDSDDSDAVWDAPAAQHSDYGSDAEDGGDAAEEVEEEGASEGGDGETEEDNNYETGGDASSAEVPPAKAAKDDEGKSDDSVGREARAAERRAARQLAKFKRFGEALARRGVVYMASVPPFMRPDKVKHLLEQYGEVTRLYLAPEDAATARRRKKLGGQRATNYTEGWIEFADKKVAKAVARSLHLQKIGGKKRSYYSEDTWNLKYLRHFTWSHLTEKKAYERRVKEHKLRLEMATVKKQNDDFRDLVDQTKKHRSIGERKAKKQRELAAGGEDGGGTDGGGDDHWEAAKKKRRFGKKGAALSGMGLASDGLESSMERAARRFHQHEPLGQSAGGGGIDSDVLRGALGHKATRG